MSTTRKGLITQSTAGIELYAGSGAFAASGWLETKTAIKTRRLKFMVFITFTGIAKPNLANKTSKGPIGPDSEWTFRFPDRVRTSLYKRLLQQKLIEPAQ